MPHVIVKMVSGRSKQQKDRLTAEIVRAVVAEAQCSESSVSVSIEDVAKDDWTETVFKPDIAAKPHTLYKKPGYGGL